MHLFAGRLVGGAHHARILAAQTLTVTLLDGNLQSPASSEGQLCIPGLCCIPFTIAQVHIHSGGVQDLAAVEQVMRIGSLFQAAHGVRQLGTIRPLEIFGARQPVAVLTAHGAAEPHRQGKDLFADRPQVPHPAGRLQIQDRADMQAACGGVCIDPPFRPVFYQNPFHLADELSQPVHRNGTVFDESYGTVRLRPGVKEAQPHPADVPNAGLVFLGLGDHQKLSHPARLFNQCRWRIAAEFHHQQRRRIAQHPAHLTRIRRHTACLTDDEARNEFDRRGMMRQ